MFAFVCNVVIWTGTGGSYKWSTQIINTADKLWRGPCVCRRNSDSEESQEEIKVKDVLCMWNIYFHFRIFTGWMITGQCYPTKEESDSWPYYKFFRYINA